jgi:hypothetical protein
MYCHQIITIRAGYKPLLLTQHVPAAQSRHTSKNANSAGSYQQDRRRPIIKVLQPKRRQMIPTANHTTCALAVLAKDAMLPQHLGGQEAPAMMQPPNQTTLNNRNLTPGHCVHDKHAAAEKDHKQYSRPGQALAVINMYSSEQPSPQDMLLQTSRGIFPNTATTATQQLQKSTS